MAGAGWLSLSYCTGSGAFSKLISAVTAGSMLSAEGPELTCCLAGSQSGRRGHLKGRLGHVEALKSTGHMLSKHWYQQFSWAIEHAPSMLSKCWKLHSCC